MSGINLENYVFVPYDKGIIIMKGDKFEFMTMPETIIRVFQEHDSMSEFLEKMKPPNIAEMNTSCYVNELFFQKQAGSLPADMIWPVN